MMRTGNLTSGGQRTYTSGCPLTTSFGKMEGTYQMITAAGRPFVVTIPAFTLSEPYSVQH